MHAFPIRFVDINVEDLARSIDFYDRNLQLTQIDGPDAGAGSAWLDAGPVILRLHQLGSRGHPSTWFADDLQLGFRHIGFGVTGIDERVEKLHEEKVPFHLEPIDADGDVRISFFYDPDGVLLEFIDGKLNYHKTWNADLAAQVQARPAPSRPTFDHVAMSAADQAATIAFYQLALGFDVSGQLFLESDPRGFEITYLHAGETVLELFTFEAEMSPSPWTPDDDTFGFRQVVFREVDDDDLPTRLVGCGAARTVGAACGCLLTDPDGFPLGIERS